MAALEVDRVQHELEADGACEFLEAEADVKVFVGYGLVLAGIGRVLPLELPFNSSSQLVLRVFADLL
jgi:hypothetical protein